MSINDPTAQHVSTPDAGRSSGRQLTDVLATVALLVVHFLLFGVTITVLGLLVMGTDSCGYQKCGDPAWLDRAINMGLWGGGAVVFADVVVTVMRLVRKRAAWFVPLIGCIAQLALGFGAAAMESMAGPV